MIDAHVYKSDSCFTFSSFEIWKKVEPLKTYYVIIIN